MDAPLGHIATAKDLLRTTLATCTAFRTIDGVSYTVDQLKARIYLDALPPPGSSSPEYTLAELQALRPFALIAAAPHGALRLRHVTAGTVRRFHPNGTLVVAIERNVPAVDAADPGQVDRDWENTIGLIMSSLDSALPGLAELSGQAGYLTISGLEVLDLYRGDQDDKPARGDYQVCLLQIEWGA
jgi:hypothetical protein